MITTALADAFLGLLDTMGTKIGLAKSITDWRAGTVVECDYTGYAQQNISWDAAEATSPASGRQRKSASAISFPQNTGTSQDAIAWFTKDGSGVVAAIGMIDDDQPVFATADDTSTELLSAPAHGLVTDQRVFVLDQPGALLPAGLSVNTAYFVLASGLTTDALKLSTTSGGSAVNITAKGACMLIPYKALTIANLATPTLADGSVIVQVGT